MTNETNEAPVIQQLDENEIYRGTIHIYSKGSADEVTMAFEFSHTLDDNWEGEIPASYDEIRRIVWAVRKQTSIYSAHPDDAAKLVDPSLSDVEKARLILESAHDQEEVAVSTVH